MPRYEFTEGSSNKFWDIKLAGKSFTTTYGKIGGTAQRTSKTFKTDAEAKSQYEKLIAEKLKKGYQPAGGAGASRDAPAARADGKRYFESGDKFWEVFVDGNSVKTRFGKVGAQGQMRLKDFKSKADAQADLDGQVAKKLKEGFAEKGASGGGAAKAAPAAAATNPELEKAILSNPYDADAYMVYADWLQDQGDPRGELIALQAAGKKPQAKKFLEQHIDYFLGPLKDHQKTHDGELGNNGRRNSKEWVAENQQAFLWKNGFIYRLRLAHDHYADEEFKGRLATDVLEPVLAHPSGKFIVEIAMNSNDDPNEDTLDDLIAILAKKAPPTVRKLRIGDNVDQISWFNVGNLSKLWKAVPNLTHLDIEAGSFTLGTIELPNLVHAVFKTGGLAKADAKSIAKATWPKIEHLEVYYGDENYGGDATAKDVLPLLDRTDLPKLKYLGVKNAEFENELVPHLAKSKLVKQLDTLDISLGVLTDDCVDAFLAAGDAFKHLTLDVSETYLSDGALKKIKGCVKKLVCTDTREDDDPEYRYVALGE